MSSDSKAFAGKLFGAGDAAKREAEARRLDQKAASTRDNTDAAAHAKAAADQRAQARKLRGGK